MPKDEKLKTCFVIAPIGDEGSEIRKRSDQVLTHIIKPAVKECGYEAVRADEISEPGIITSQVIQHIIDDDLVIADLTGKNPNVFYELAVRHTVRKPVVQLIESSESIPFDVAPTRTIHFDLGDLDSVANCKDELIRQIRSVEKDVSKVDSPISVAIDLKLLRQSDNPLEESNARIISMLEDLRSLITDVTAQRRPSIDTQLLVEQKVKELTALNNLFVTYLNQGFEAAEIYGRLARSIIKMSVEIQRLVKETEAQKLAGEISRSAEKIQSLAKEYEVLKVGSPPLRPREKEASQ